MWVGDLLPFNACNMHFSSLSPSLSCSSLYIFCFREAAEHRCGVVLTLAVRRRAVAEPTQEYPRSSQHSPPSQRRQTHSLRLRACSVSARRSEVCVICHIKPGSAPITTRRLAPSTCAGVCLCSCGHSGAPPSTTEAASWKHKVLQRGTPAS